MRDHALVERWSPGRRGRKLGGPRHQTGLHRRPQPVAGPRGLYDQLQQPGRCPKVRAGRVSGRTLTAVLPVGSSDVTATLIDGHLIAIPTNRNGAIAQILPRNVRTLSYRGADGTLSTINPGCAPAARQGRHRLGVSAHSAPLTKQRQSRDVAHRRKLPRQSGRHPTAGPSPCRVCLRVNPSARRPAHVDNGPDFRFRRSLRS
jgi:hypothetical protein